VLDIQYPKGLNITGSFVNINFDGAFYEKSSTILYDYQKTMIVENMGFNILFSDLQYGIYYIGFNKSNAPGIIWYGGENGVPIILTDSDIEISFKYSHGYNIYEIYRDFDNTLFKFSGQENITLYNMQKEKIVGTYV